MQLIYDAVQMDVVDANMIGVSIFGMVAFSIAAIGMVVRHRGGWPQRWRQENPFAPLIAVIIFAFSFAYLAYSAIETELWRSDYANHRYDVVDGCVTNFNEVIQSDHDLGVDTFDLEGRHFKLSDSGWRLGYHLSHHHGSPIEEGVHLRVFASGPRLMRIEQNGNCSPTSRPA